MLGLTRFELNRFNRGFESPETIRGWLKFTTTTESYLEREKPFNVEDEKKPKISRSSRSCSVESIESSISLEMAQSLPKAVTPPKVPPPQPKLKGVTGLTFRNYRSAYKANRFQWTGCYLLPNRVVSIVEFAEGDKSYEAILKVLPYIDNHPNIEGYVFHEEYNGKTYLGYQSTDENLLKYLLKMSFGGNVEDDFKTSVGQILDAFEYIHQFGYGELLYLLLD